MEPNTRTRIPEYHTGQYSIKARQVIVAVNHFFHVRYANFSRLLFVSWLWAKKNMFARILLLVALVLAFYFYTQPSQRTTTTQTTTMGKQCKRQPEDGICRLQKLEATFAQLGLDDVYRAPKQNQFWTLCGLLSS